MPLLNRWERDDVLSASSCSKWSRQILIACNFSVILCIIGASMVASLASFLGEKERHIFQAAGLCAVYVIRAIRFSGGALIRSWCSSRFVLISQQELGLLHVQVNSQTTQVSFPDKLQVKPEASLYGFLLLESLFCNVGIPTKLLPHLQMPGAA